MKFHVDSKENSRFRVLSSNIWQCFSHLFSNKWSKTPKTWKFGPISIQHLFNTHLSTFNRWDFCFQTPLQIEAFQNIPLASMCKRSAVITTSPLTGVLQLLPLNSPMPTNYLTTTRNPGWAMRIAMAVDQACWRSFNPLKKAECCYLEDES